LDGRPLVNFPPMHWDQLELPFSAPAVPCSALATFEECPMCASALEPEHAHFRCPHCGWRDSCCD
jgi:hypothetical protein